MNLTYEIDRLLTKLRSVYPDIMRLKQQYKIDLSLTSNGLSGSSLTDEEAISLLKKGITVNVEPLKEITLNQKPLKHHLEVLGHSDAVEYIFKLGQKSTFGKKHMIKLHRIYYQRIDKKRAGQFRSEVLRIPGSKYSLPAPDDIPHQMDKFSKRLEFYRKNHHPVEYAAKIHKEFLFICPFDSGNGRMARLLMNLALMQKDYFPCIIPREQKDEYLQALERSHIDENIFQRFIVAMVQESYEELLSRQRLEAIH